MADNYNRGSNNNQQEPATTTQIRNLYSRGKCYLNVSFMNLKLSLKFFPYKGKNQNGNSSYDLQAGLYTAIGWDRAFAMYDTIQKILDGNMQECRIVMPMQSGGPDDTLVFERVSTGQNHYDTNLTITRQGQSIQFTFETMDMQVRENGKEITKTIETGLGVFQKTLEGYLNGVNAERHLNKMTEEYAKSQQNNQQSNRFQNSNKSYGGNNKQYNGNNRGYNNGYNRNYNNRGSNNGNNGNWNPPNQQNYSSYEIKN